MDVEELSENLKNTNQWLRIVFMVLFAVILNVVGLVLWAVVCVQALFALLTGSDNGNIRGMAAGLAQYIFDVVRYLTYNSEDKPFPFQPWPVVEVEQVAVVAEESE